MYFFSLHIIVLLFLALTKRERVKYKFVYVCERERERAEKGRIIILCRVETTKPTLFLLVNDKTLSSAI
jgi:hypothetical protein